MPTRRQCRGMVVARLVQSLIPSHKASRTLLRSYAGNASLPFQFGTVEAQFALVDFGTWPGSPDPQQRSR